MNQHLHIQNLIQQAKHLSDEKKSIAKDIIKNKELLVETKEGEDSEFSIQLPII